MRGPLRTTPAPARATLGDMSAPIIAAIDPQGTDFSPAVLAAVLARTTHAPVLLATAYPMDSAIDRLYPEYARTLRQDAERVLRRATAVVEELPGAPVDVGIEAVPDQAGPPARALQRLAERTSASRIVAGSSPRGTLGRVSPRAVTDRLLHGAPCPVVVTPAGYLPPPGGLRLVGAAFVDRADGYNAVEAARALAEDAGARVRVFTVAEPLDPVLLGTLDSLAIDDTLAGRQRDAEQRLRIALDTVPAALSAGGEVLHGRVVDALAAASPDLDLLVCGTRDYGPMRTLAAGGTSHALVRRAASPVLVVGPAAGAERRLDAVAAA